MLGAVTSIVIYMNFFTDNTKWNWQNFHHQAYTALHDEDRLTDHNYGYEFYLNPPANCNHGAGDHLRDQHMVVCDLCGQVVNVDY